MVLLQGLCYVVDITMVFLTFIGIFVTLVFLANIAIECHLDTGLYVYASG